MSTPFTEQPPGGLLHEIERYCAEFDVPITLVGLDSCRNGGLVATLRKGRTPQAKTVEKVRKYLFAERLRHWLDARPEGAKADLRAARDHLGLGPTDVLAVFAHGVALGRIDEATLRSAPIETNVNAVYRRLNGQKRRDMADGLPPEGTERGATRAERGTGREAAEALERRKKRDAEMLAERRAAVAGRPCRTPLGERFRAIIGSVEEESARHPGGAIAMVQARWPEDWARVKAAAASEGCLPGEMLHRALTAGLDCMEEAQ